MAKTKEQESQAAGLLPVGLPSPSTTPPPIPTKSTPQSDPFQQQEKSKLDGLLKNITQHESAYSVFTPLLSPQVIDTLSPDNCIDIINNFALKSKCTQEEAIIGITYLIQHGGTNLSKKSLKIHFGETIFTIDTLREVVKEVEKTATVRKFAKGIRDLIICVAKINRWPGPLRNNIKINNPNQEIREEDAIWCLEVHSDNPKCPTLIRECLIRREEQLRANQNNSNSKTQNGPRKGRGKTGK